MARISFFVCLCLLRSDDRLRLRALWSCVRFGKRRFADCVCRAWASAFVREFDQAIRLPLCELPRVPTSTTATPDHVVEGGLTSLQKAWLRCPGFLRLVLPSTQARFLKGGWRFRRLIYDYE